MVNAKMLPLARLVCQSGFLSPISKLPWCAKRETRRLRNLRYSVTRRSRNQILLVLVLILDSRAFENEDDDDDRPALPATISADTDRLGGLGYRGAVAAALGSHTLISPPPRLAHTE